MMPRTYLPTALSSSDDASPESVGVIVSADGGIVSVGIVLASGCGDDAVAMGEDGGENVGCVGTVGMGIGIGIALGLERDAATPKDASDADPASPLRYRANGLGAAGVTVGGAPLKATGGGLFAYASKPDTARGAGAGAGVVRVSLNGNAPGRLEDAGEMEYSVCDCD